MKYRRQLLAVTLLGACLLGASGWAGEERKETPKKEEPRKEEPRKEEPRKETPRKEEPRKEEPRKPLNPKDPGYYEELLKRRAESQTGTRSEEEARRKRAEEERRKKEEEARKKAEEERKKRQEEYRKKEEASRRELDGKKPGEGVRREEPRKEEPRKEEPRKEEPRRDGEKGDDGIIRPALPSGAYGFAGMIRATVLAKDGARLRVKVEGVEPWGHSRASEARALIGKEVSVEVDRSVFKNPQQAEGPLRFCELVQVGQTELFDVSNRSGNVLAFLELTKSQRERVEAARR